ncbi:MAG: YceI family protein [Bacteroidetes bacterium]|nr:YceI family protein [Bacteroidota bacterium]
MRLWILATGIVCIPLIVNSQFLLEGSIEFKKESTLVIRGTTNVNEFKCVLDETDDVSSFSNYSLTDSSILLDNAIMTFQVDNFDCGNKAITKDFRKALGSRDFPKIMFEIRRIYITNEERLQEKSTVKSEVSITIAGVRKDLRMNLQRFLLEDSQIRYSGEKSLLMSDFGVNPPQALWGVIKARDDIDVSFMIVFKFL